MKHFAPLLRIFILLYCFFRKNNRCFFDFYMDFFDICGIINVGKEYGT